MNFAATYKLSFKAERPAPAVIQTLGIAPGIYDEGLVTVLDTQLSASIADAWSWLIGLDAVPIVSTLAGDFFFWSESQGATFFMEADFGKSTYVDREIDYLFDGFLIKDGVKDKVLGRALLPGLAERLGPLPYGACYIAFPSAMFGGSRALDDYSTGDLDVYLSIAAQTAKQRLDAKLGK